MVVNIKQWSFREKGPLGYGRTLIAYTGSRPPRHSTSTYDGPGGVFTIAILKNHDQPFYNKLKTLKDIDDQLFDVTPVDELEVAIIEADDYIESIQTKVRKLRISAITVDPPINADVVGRDGSTMNNSPMALSNRRVNLPKLQLPTFDGNTLL